MKMTWQAAVAADNSFRQRLHGWLRPSKHWVYSPLIANLIIGLLTIALFIREYARISTSSEPSRASSTAQTASSGLAVSPIIQLQPATDQLAPIREGQIIDGLAFGHDGNALFATGIEHTIYQWRLPTGELLPTIDVESSSVNHIGLDRAGTLLAYSGRDGAVGLISLAYSWRRQFTPHRGAIAALHVSHNGRALFTSSMDGTLMHHDLVSGESRLLRSDPQDPIFAVTADTTDELLAFATNHSIQIWRWATRKVLYQLVGHQGPVNWVEFSPDGRYLLSAGSDHTIRLWDVAAQTERHRFTESTNAIKVVRYFPNGTLFVGAGDDGLIRVWDAQSYELVEEIEGFLGGVATLAINYNGSQLAAVGRNGALTIWNIVPNLATAP